MKIHVSRTLTRCIYDDAGNPNKFNQGHFGLLAQMYLPLSKSGLRHRCRQRKSLRVVALGQRLRHFAHRIDTTVGEEHGERMRHWFETKKAGWYAVLEDPKMPAMSTMLDGCPSQTDGCWRVSSWAIIWYNSLELRNNRIPREIAHASGYHARPLRSRQF